MSFSPLEFAVFHFVFSFLFRVLFSVFHMHTGYTLIQPYVFLTLNSLLTNEHLLSSPADLFCYEFSGDVSLKFVASPYTELIIGQRPDGSCRIFCIRTADEPLILKLSGFSYCFGVRFDESLYYRLPGHPFPFPADLLQTISMSDSDIFSGTVSFSERIQRFLSALNKTGKTPVCPPAATLIHQSIKKADGDITVSELAARTGYSCRHISRIFTEYFGYSPKTFCRLLRFHHTLYEIFQDPHRNNSEFITQIGYSDQAHFQREFKTFMGETPRRFGRRLIQQKF